MKKLFIIVFTVIALIVSVIFFALPYYFGMKAEETLNEQHRLLASSTLLTVESRQYERGWFGATETMTVRLKPTLLHNARKYIPENVKTFLGEPITVVNHIKHGPFVYGIKPVRAHVETEFQYTQEAEKVLKRFFGEQAPVSISNTVNLGGSGSLSMRIPAFDYEELSGIKLDWKGLEGTTDYASGFETYTHDYRAPSLAVKLADKGDIALENLHIKTTTDDGVNKLSLGSSSVSLDKFSIEWKEGIEYNVKVNELVNLVTDLQIGAFINPTGTIAPSKIIVDKFQFETQTNEADKWINSRGRFRFEKLTYGNDRYGPLDIDASAEHLDAQGLLAIKNKMAELTVKEMTEEEIQNELLKTAKNEASGLFTQNPVLNINTFNFKTPEGTVDAKGRLAFNNLTVADMDDFGAMVKKTLIDLDLQVPQKLLEQLAIRQAGSIFSVNPEDAAEGVASIEDINETLRLMVDSTIQTMGKDGYLKLEDGNVRTNIHLSDNLLKLNGKELEVEPDPVFTEEDMVGGVEDVQASQP
ncbi:YdgA family protein [Neisseria weaveri]|uniref:YdgA family protein n=1 Tax=Neisseria weaveri TaxID=28091 RepID=UPI0007C99B26|nr:YdgA family protein [Neisseria weaveri]SAY50372.1 secreted protein [Neisseria weaveri]